MRNGTPNGINSCVRVHHESRKTLRHESTHKINFETGDYAKTHEQFRNRKMTCEEVIDYIAAHDEWRQRDAEKPPAEREE